MGEGRSRAPSSACLPAWPGYCPAAGSMEPRFRRDSLFCPDELDSLFSYFDAGAAAAGPRSKSPAAHHPQLSQGSSEQGPGMLAQRVDKYGTAMATHPGTGRMGIPCRRD